MRVGTRKGRSESISVVIPCFNCAEHLGRAIGSINLQTVLPLEIILVDDFSTDNGATKNVIRSFVDRCPTGSHPQITAIWLEKNIGPGGARNAGWESAKGDYIAFLDADDAWHPCKLAIQHNWMTLNPDCHGTGHKTVVIQNLDSVSEFVPRIDNFRRLSLNSMLFRNRLKTRTVMLRRDITHRFPPDARFAEDYALWIDLIASGHSMFFLDSELAFSFRSEFSNGGLSGQLWSMEKAELSIFLQLIKKKEIRWPLGFLILIFSVLKFWRRIVIRQLRSLCIGHKMRY